METKELKKNILWALLYGAITLFLVFHHEIWADEAQVWLLAKNLSVSGLLKHLVNEGHPSVFYILIMPFAKLLQGAGAIFSMQIICWSASVLSVFLLLQFSPFSRLTKFAIISSAGFLYYFPVIARSYSILPLLVFLAAILYLKSKEKPILYAVVLALIANTHVIMFGFCTVLTALFLFENKKTNIAASLIMMSGLAAVILQLSGTMNSNGIISFGFSNVLPEVLKTASIFFLNSVDIVFKNAFEPPNLTFVSIVSAAIMFVLFIVLLFKLFLTDRKMGIIALLGIGFQFFIYIFSYKVMLYPTRIFCAYLILIFCWWIAFDKDTLNKKTINILLSIFFLLTFFTGVKASLLDLFNNYSSAGETASYIEKNIDKNAIIIPSADAFALAVYEKLPEKDFYSIYKNHRIKYMIWYTPVFYSDSGFTELLEKNTVVQKNEKIYILVSSFLDNFHFEKTTPQNYELIYKSSPAIATGEAFRIYEFIKK